MSFSRGLDALTRMRYCLLGFVLLMTMTTWPVPGMAQSYHGWCTQGGTTPVTTGVPASRPFVVSFPACTIGVTSVATGMPATLTDLTGALLSNPFMNSGSGNTMTGEYSFIITSGPGAYNVTITAPGLMTYTFRINIGGTTVDCSSFTNPTGGAKLAACIAALPATGGIADATNITGPQTITQDVFAGNTKPVTLLLGAATYTISAGQTLPSNNSRIRCQSTMLVRSGSIILWTISGMDDTFEDCIVDGGGAGPSNEVISANGSTRATIRHNTISNYGNNSDAIFLQSATDTRIVTNSIFGQATNGRHPIYVFGFPGLISGVTIDGNRLDVSASSTSGTKAIEIQVTNGPGIGNITVTNNIISAAAMGMCLEANPNGTTTIVLHDLVVSGNTCTFTAPGTAGFSIAGFGTENVVVSNNTVDAGGFSVGIAAFELTGTHSFAAVGNTIRNGSQMVGFSVGNDNGTISGNTIDGFASAGISVGVNYANGFMEKLTINNNAITFTPGTANVSAVSLSCSHATAICRNITITGNSIFGTGTAGSIGINASVGTTAPMSDITIDGNSIYATLTGIQANGITGLSITNNIYDAANTAGTGINSSTLTNFNISHNTFTSFNAGVLAYTIQIVIIVDSLAVDGIIADNQISGVLFPASNYEAIRIDSTGATAMERITVSRNTINAHGNGTGINASCTGTATICRNILIKDNNIIGDLTVGATGIVLSGNGFQRTSVSGNNISSFDNCIYNATTSNTFVGQIANNIFNCNTAFEFSLGSTGMTLIDSNGIPTAGIPTALANGSQIYVTDATIANPCAGAGTGAILKRLNGVNVCN